MGSVISFGKISAITSNIFSLLFVSLLVPHDSNGVPRVIVSQILGILFYFFSPYHSFFFFLLFVYPFEKFLLTFLKPHQLFPCPHVVLR